MSLWAGIKHALNSTLGTSGFKPLNTMLDEVKSDILSEIDGQRSLAASDSVLKVLFSGNEIIGSTGNPEKEVGSFVPRKDGSVRVSAKIYKENSSSDATATLSVLQNKTTLGSVTIPVSAKGYYTCSVDVPIVTGTTYTVKVGANKVYTYVNTVELCSSIVDTSLLEVI